MSCFEIVSLLKIFPLNDSNVNLLRIADFGMWDAERGMRNETRGGDGSSPRMVSNRTTP